MSLPDDLSPAERIELERLLHGSAASVPAGYDGRTEPETETISTSISSTIPTAIPFHGNHLDTDSGKGAWQGHFFTLSPDRLKAVHSIVADAIAADLTAEIERLRGAVL